SFISLSAIFSPPSGSLSTLDRGVVNPLNPFEVPTSPDPKQPGKQNRDEGHDLHQRDDTHPGKHPLAKNQGHRNLDRNFDFEDHEYQRDNVKTRIEVEPSPSDRPLPALVNEIFLRVREFGPKQRSHQQVRQREADGRNHENEHHREIKLHAAPHSNRGS